MKYYDGLNDGGDVRDVAMAIMKICDKHTRVSDDIILIMKHLDGIYGSELYDNNDVMMMVMMVMTMIMMITMISDKQTQQEAVEASLHNKTLIVSTILVSSHHCHRHHRHHRHHHKHHHHEHHHDHHHYYHY